MLQILLGHTETRTTEIYIHLANLLHVENYAKYSIISGLKPRMNKL